MRRARVLIFGRDAPSRAAVAAGLLPLGFECSEAQTPTDGLARVQRGEADAVVVGAGGSSTEDAGEASALVSRIRGAGSDAAIVALVPGDGVDAAVAALRSGADAHLLGAADPTRLALLLEKALERRRLERDAALLREQLRRRQAIVGTSADMLVAVDVVHRAAPTKAPIIVVGESGTGRTLFAQAIHDASPRRGGPFVRVNCAGLSQGFLDAELFGHAADSFADVPQRGGGRIAAADGGTLYLHEVGALPAPLQIKLLRVLQHGELERAGGAETIRVDVRVVASSGQDLASQVQAGRFRDDLYYRLAVVAVSLPPLRARKGDLPALVEHFTALSSRERGLPRARISPGALSAVFAHDWPGNARELELELDAAVARAAGAEIGVEHLSATLRGGFTPQASASALIPGATLFEIEREAILRTLEQCEGSTVRAAEILGISVRKIQYRLKEYRTGVPGARGGHEGPPQLYVVGGGRRG